MKPDPRTIADYDRRILRLRGRHINGADVVENLMSTIEVIREALPNRGSAECELYALNALLGVAEYGVYQ